MLSTQQQKRQKLDIHDLTPDFFVLVLLFAHAKGLSVSSVILNMTEFCSNSFVHYMNTMSMMTSI